MGFFNIKLPFLKPKDPAYVPPKRLTQAEAIARYGTLDLANKTWKREVEFMGLVAVPESIKPYLINTATGKPTNKIYTNKDVAQALIQAFMYVEQRGLQSLFKSFDGCLNIREVRGVPGALSTHSYGMAIDINVKGNELGVEPTIDPLLVKCFTDAGWTWGGTFKRKDGQHFSYCWE